MGSGTRNGGCLVAGTKVYTPNGGKDGINIETIKAFRFHDKESGKVCETPAKDLVPLLTRTSEAEYKAYPLDSFWFKSVPTVQIRFLVGTEDGEFPDEPDGRNTCETILNISLGHPFFTSDGEVVPAEYLKRHDYVYAITNGEDRQRERIARVESVIYKPSQRVYGLVLASEDYIGGINYVTDDARLGEASERLRNDTNRGRIKNTILEEVGLVYTNVEIEKLVEDRVIDNFYEYLLGETSPFNNRQDMIDNRYKGLDLEDHFIYTDLIVSGDWLMQTRLNTRIRKTKLSELRV